MRIFVFLFLLNPVAFASNSYQDLITKDYKEMKALINEHKGKESSLLGLKKALKVLLMRPDRDGLSRSLMPSLKNEISRHKSFSAVLNELVQESISFLKSEDRSLSERISHLFIIENALLHARYLKSDKVLKTISKSKIKISKKIIAERMLNSGDKHRGSPSQMAELILKKRKQMVLEKLKEKERKAQKHKAKKPGESL